MVAKTIAYAIMPACQASLHHSQKGFIPGRNGGEHIRELTDSFYSDLASKVYSETVFIDFKKAYDSLDHSFIKEVMERKQFRSWLINMIRLLYWGAMVIPVLAARTTVRMEVERGVKQGCPLSPILFDIVLDVLLVFLHKVRVGGSGPSIYAFADDLAIKVLNLPVLTMCLEVVTLFGRYSGLEVNRAKCAMLCSMAPTAQMRRTYLTLPWKVPVVSSYIYLGVLIGRKIEGNRHYLSLRDIYDRPMERLRKRVKTLRPILQRLPLHHRVIGVNTFLLSLFSYIYQFYLPDAVTCKEVNRLVGPCVVPFKGRAFRQQILYLGGAQGVIGLRTPLHDLYALALTALSNQFPLHEFDNQVGLAIPGFDYSNGLTLKSLRVQDQIRYAATDMVFLGFTDHVSGRVATADLKPHSSRVRRVLYRSLIDATWGSVLRDPEEKGNYYLKGSRWGLSTIEVDNMHARMSRYASLIPPHLLAHHTRMYLNALPTSERLSKFTGDRYAAIPRTCLLCGSVSSTVYLDSIHHLYDGGCTVMVAAHHSWVSIFTPQFSLCLANSMLGYQVDPVQEWRAKLRVLLTLHFNWSSYHTRRRLFNFLETPHTHDKAVRIIVSVVITSWIEMVRRTRGKFISRLGIDYQSQKLLRPLSDSTSRKKRKKPTDPATLLRLSGAPVDALVYYTDGAASPNPGPSGAAACLYINDRPSIDLMAPLGMGTNNIGEFYALGMVFNDATKRLSITDSSTRLHHVYVATDSELALRVVEGKAHIHDKTSVLHTIAHHVIASYRWIRSRVHLHLLKVSSHTGLNGNDRADSVAIRAAGRSQPADRWRVAICQGTGEFPHHPV
jgi:ribonuclease HI